MSKEITTLGELVFNGTILFLSVSFGLFTLSLSGGGVTISSVFLFAIWIILVVLFGIAALVTSFLGIKFSNMNLIYASAICFFIMIILLVVVHAQIYINVLTNTPTLKT